MKGSVPLKGGGLKSINRQCLSLEDDLFRLLARSLCSFGTWVWDIPGACVSLSWIRCMCDLCYPSGFCPVLSELISGSP